MSHNINPNASFEIKSMLVNPTTKKGDLLIHNLNCNRWFVESNFDVTITFDVVQNQYVGCEATSTREVELIGQDFIPYLQSLGKELWIQDLYEDGFIILVWKSKPTISTERVDPFTQYV